MSKAAMVERVEMIAESDGRSGKEADCGAAMTRAMDRYPGALPLDSRDLDHLALAYWQHYAAGVKHPEEATDVTLRRWQGE